ncbi:MAG: short-chain dehydrogenase/reductase [Myxococcaceae bacterium]|nr:short-chain dehydrogenase/reductase [Myxococcaceae bacterium]
MGMEGKLVLITGGTAGIGKQAALGLLQQGAQVVIVGRNAEKTQGVVEELKARSANPKLDYLLADLSSMAQVRRVAAEFRAKYPRLDVLLNNAGGVFPGRTTTGEGFERTLATNHLSFFVLTHELLPVLEKSAPARVVNVTSNGHRFFKIDFDDLMAEKSYNMWVQYCRSKAANLLFTRELARRVNARTITVNCLHPGFVASDFLAKPGFWNLIKPIAYLGAIDETKGAKTSIYLASSPEVEGVTGKYFEKCAEAKPSAFCRDDAAAKRLWEMTERLVANVGTATRAA